MFVISPVRDIDERNKIISDLKITEIPCSFMYSMKDKQSGALLGASQFDIFDGYGYIYDLRCATEPFDFEAMFILGRATMNFIDLCDVHICRIKKDASDGDLYRAIGFRTECPDCFECDMTGMFDGNCSSEKKGVSNEI